MNELTPNLDNIYFPNEGIPLTDKHYHEGIPLTDKHQFICLGPISDSEDDIEVKLYLAKRKVIEFNKSSKGNRTLTLHPLRRNTVEITKTFVEQSFLAIQKTYQEKKLLRTVVTVSVLTVFFFSELLVLKNYMHKMNEIHSPIDDPNSQIEYVREVMDPTTASIVCTVMNAWTSLALGILPYKAIDGDPTFHHYKEIANLTNRSVHLIQIQRPFTSVGNIPVEEYRFANEIEDGEILDPISGTKIPRDNIQSPTTIIIGKYLFTLESVLSSIFSRDIQSSSGEIPHPMENRVMNGQERDKFVNDLANLLSTNYRTVINCWSYTPQEMRAIGLFNNTRELLVQSIKEITKNKFRAITGSELIYTFPEEDHT